MEALRKKRRAYYALCVAVWAMLPADHPYPTPEDLAPALKDAATVKQAMEGLQVLLRAFFGLADEQKKSESSSSSPGPAPRSTSGSASPPSTIGA
jgi:hypothetical protein